MENTQTDIPEYAPPQDPERWFHKGWFSRSFLIVAGFFFLLPFININCSGVKLASIKGIDLVKGGEIQKEDSAYWEHDKGTNHDWEEGSVTAKFLEESGNFLEKGDQKKVAPNILAIISVIAVILSLVFSFFGKRILVIISGGLALLSALSLFFIQIQINNAVETKIGPFNFSPLAFEFTPYYWLCILFLSVSAIFSFVRSAVIIRK